MQPLWAVGLMTGTVLDGNIDVALLKTDGETVTEFGAYALKPYPRWIRDLLEQAQAEARIWNFEGSEPNVFAEAEEALTRAICGCPRTGRGKRALDGGYRCRRLPRANGFASRAASRSNRRHEATRRRKAYERTLGDHGRL